MFKIIFSLFFSTVVGKRNLTNSFQIENTVGEKKIEKIMQLEGLFDFADAI